MSTTIILGTGIIGTSTAFYLSKSQPGSSIHLVESSPKLFASASGYAGGFLALDWFSSPVQSLGKLSFEEHARLAEEFNGREKWGYASSTALSYSSDTGKDRRRRGDDWLREGTSRAVASGETAEEHDQGLSRVPKWLKRVAGDEVEVISTDGTVAQVDPLKLSSFLLEKCLESGVQLHHPAKAISVSKDLRDELSSIRILNLETEAETDIPCTKILIAAGAWSAEVFKTLFPSSRLSLPISKLAGHSLIVRSPTWRDDEEDIECHAVFATESNGYSPEIFSRVGGDIYIAGLNSATLALPNRAAESNVDKAAVMTLEDTAKRLLVEPNAGNLEIMREGLCFRPVTPSGTPILAKIPDEKLGRMMTRGDAHGGLWLASGHGPWGISLSLGTGIIMAEMIQGKKTTADIGGLGFKDV